MNPTLGFRSLFGARHVTASEVTLADASEAGTASAGDATLAASVMGPVLDCVGGSAG